MARTTNAPSCAYADCYLPRRHRQDCDHQQDPGPDACPGCLPAQAAPGGLRLCDRCTNLLAVDPRNAAQLHGDLLLQLRRSARGEHTSGSRDRSPGIDTAVAEARTHIATTLRGLTRLIQTERGFKLPGQWIVDRRPVGFVGPMPRRWYADTTMPSLGAFVAANAEWLAAHTDAGTHAARLRTAAHGRVWALAYPIGPTTVFIGECPLPVVFVSTDDTGKQTFTDGTCGERLNWDLKTALIQCPGCEKAETVEWWQRKMTGEDNGGVVTAQTGAAWLSMHWFRDVRPSVLANWASRDKLPRLLAAPETPDAPPPPLKDERGRTLFSLADVKACAEKTWGPPPQLRPRRKTPAAA